MDHVGNRIEGFESIEENAHTAKMNLEKTRDKMRKQFDEHGNAVEFEKGEYVLLRNEAAKKFEPQWFGPYLVEEVYANGTVLLTDPTGARLDSRVHKDRLKKGLLARERNITWRELKAKGWCLSKKIEKRHRSELSREGEF